MGEAALQYEFSEEPSHPTLTLIQGGPLVQQTSKSVIILTVTLILLQLMDGILTGIGMYHFGHGAEGNPFLRLLMNEFGYVPALIMSKGLAIGIVCFLAYFASHIKWIKGAMMGVVALYVTAAIIPWSIILATRVFWA